MRSYESWRFWPSVSINLGDFEQKSITQIFFHKRPQHQHTHARRWGIFTSVSSIPPCLITSFRHYIVLTLMTRHCKRIGFFRHPIVDCILLTVNIFSKSWEICAGGMIFGFGMMALCNLLLLYFHQDLNRKGFWYWWAHRANSLTWLTHSCQR